MRQPSMAAAVLSRCEKVWGCAFLQQCVCVCGVFAELHAPLEAVCQRHRQRLRLRRGSHVCQGHLCWGQQGRGECTRTQLCQMCETMRDEETSSSASLRLKTWWQKSNGHSRTTSNTSAGWTRKPKKPQKRRWDNFGWMWGGNSTTWR